MSQTIPALGAPGETGLKRASRAVLGVRVGMVEKRVYEVREDTISADGRAA